MHISNFLNFPIGYNKSRIQFAAIFFSLRENGTMMEERTFDLRGHSTNTKSQNHKVQWRPVGWQDTSRHFVNSISLSFPLPAHEFPYRPGPVSHVCSFSRLSIRKFLKHSSKRVLIVSCKMSWKNWKTEQQQTIPISPPRCIRLFIFQGLLISCNQMSAEYLFMTDKLYDVKYDTGDKVIQCGRHNDIFKLWLQWRAKVNSIDRRRIIDS